jgi:cytochrome c oxidase assembly protein subunit 11
MYTSAVIVFFSGLTYAAVPLYRLFCSSTGFAGTPQVGTGKFLPERLVPVEEARRIKVHFNANHADQLPWSFTPEQKFVTVLPGETSLAFYKAKNISPHDIIGIATYNVTPDRVNLSCQVEVFQSLRFIFVRPPHIFRKWNVSVSRNRSY